MTSEITRNARKQERPEICGELPTAFACDPPPNPSTLRQWRTGRIRLKYKCSLGSESYRLSPLWLFVTCQRQGGGGGAGGGGGGGGLLVGLDHGHLVALTWPSVEKGNAWT